ANTLAAAIPQMEKLLTQNNPDATKDMLDRLEKQSKLLERAIGPDADDKLMVLAEQVKNNTDDLVEHCRQPGNEDRARSDFDRLMDRGQRLVDALNDEAD